MHLFVCLFACLLACLFVCLFVFFNCCCFLNLYFFHSGCNNEEHEDQPAAIDSNPIMVCNVIEATGKLTILY